MDKILNKIKRLIPKNVYCLLQPLYHYIFSWLAAVIYKNPSRNVIVIGVTGTTGKTTTVYMIAKVLEHCGYKVGYTSTALFNDGKKEWMNNKKMTMLGRFFTQKIISRMVKNGCHYAIIETTSEGIKQYRHKFINYDILVYTGLYPEHIESHGSFEKYRSAKEKLFEHLQVCKTKYIDDHKRVIKPKSELIKTELIPVKKTTIINGDDENANYFYVYAAEQKFIIAGQPNIQLKPKTHDQVLVYKKKESLGINSKFTVEGEQISLKILGDFNIVNAMLAYGCSRSQDIEKTLIKTGLEKISGIPGRLEKIDQGQNFMVIVDYAFEPVAVAKLYETVKKLEHQNIIHVLGAAGGGRDVARRPILGELAGKNADYVIITNEDPYDDDPEIIIDQVALGAEKTKKKINQNIFKILDRKAAIEKALKMAQKDDIVLITGKGSEQAICVEHGKKIPWDDRKIVKEILKGL